MLRVKISSRGSGKGLDLQQFVGNDENAWGGCRFFVNEPIESADVWLVVEDLDDDDRTCQVPPSRIAFLTAETSWPSGHYDESTERSAFLDQFAAIRTCHDIYRANVVADIPYLPWMINANHGSVTARHERDVHYFRSLTGLPKSRDLSVFCSTQTMTPGHRMRLRFVEQLKSHFGDRLDWFGNGINPVDEKWDGLAPYRHTIVLENHPAVNVITEKIADAYLGLAYPIYSGAPNLADYYPAESFTAIDIKDVNGSIAVIEDVLSQNLAEQRRDALLEAKARVVGNLHLYERMSRLAQALVSTSVDEPAAAVTLRRASAGSNPAGGAESLLRVVGESFNKVGDVLVRRSMR